MPKYKGKMSISPREIELGNGYGYFCNIHDVENQCVQKNDSKYTNKFNHLEEMDLIENTADSGNTSICTCSAFACIVMILLFVF